MRVMFPLGIINLVAETIKAILTEEDLKEVLFNKINQIFGNINNIAIIYN